VESRLSASILIPSLGRPEYLSVSLQSVVPQASAAGAEVIVISDGPHPGVSQVAGAYPVTLITLPEHRGLNAARNAGIDAAHSDVLVLIDDDVDAPPGWLDAMLTGIRANPEVEVFGGPIRGRLEGGPRGCGREPPPITALEAGTADQDIPRAWGANMVIRRSALERVGMFDEGLSGRGDEDEWERRYTASGGRIRYLAQAGLDHRRTESDSRLGALARAAYGQGREARRSDERLGIARPVRHELRVLVGCAWHTVRRRCAFGIVMGARSAGHLREALLRRP
jgi:GT2 family glycosyltransferase